MASSRGSEPDVTIEFMPGALPPSCPQCGQEPWATYYEKNYGVAPGVAMAKGWPLGNHWAVCVFGHHWVPALLGQEIKSGL